MEYVLLAIGLGAVKASTLFALNHSEFVITIVIAAAGVAGISMLIGYGIRLLKGSGRVAAVNESSTLRAVGVAVMVGSGFRNHDGRVDGDGALSSR